MAKKQNELFNSKTSDEDFFRAEESTDPTQERINLLVDQIRTHRYLYYNKAPEITDAKFDAIEDELRQLEPNHPVLNEIGQDSSGLFAKREHIIMMGSQDKVVTPEEFTKWAKKVGHHKFLVQYKLDGISIELQYKNGIFQCAVSRGDGLIGDDYTQNVMNMNGFIPILKGNFTGAVRAEVLLFRDIFNSKYSDKENCRNASSGLVRRKDGKGSEDLNLVYYDAISIDEHIKFNNEVQKVKWLKSNDFDVVQSKVYATIDEVIALRNDVMENKRDLLNFDIDGLVIKGTEIDLKDMKRAKPMKQIAFKFAAEEIETTLVDVEWSISGHNYTPVAIVEPVRLMGTTVKRASLANPNLIKELGVKIGSSVIISKRGDIIPKIERVISTPSDAKEILLPTKCEVCNTPLTNEGTLLYCPNEDCPKRKYHRLVKWIKKLNVKHFSEKLMLKPLFDSGKVQTIADLYELNVHDLTKLDNVKETSAKKALNNLSAVKEISLERFIAGFNIENIGELMVKKVVDAGYDSLDKILNSSVNDLSMVDGFAEITAEFLLVGLEKVYPEMEQLLNLNRIKIIIEEKVMSSNKLAGLSFCVTGSFEHFKNRGEAEQLILKHGGMFKKNVVKNLSYLVTNSTEQTTKYTAAQSQKDTKIITEQNLLDMINE